MRSRWVRIRTGSAVLAALALLLTGCTTVVSGIASAGNAPDASLPVKGGGDDAFDVQVKNSLSDIMAFWRSEYPKVSGGKSLPPLRGGLYSVDGSAVARTHQVQGPAATEGCIRQDPTFIIDNGAYCTADDSIIWDRAPTHLFAQLAKKYGPLLVALIFAHEFGHAISFRLGVFDENRPTIDTESQADCAAGAWAGWAMKGNAAHFRTATPAKLADALEGFLDGRDATPGTPNDVSHGNGFDRLSALADGIDKGATYCFSPGYFDSRTFTERPFTDPNDYASGGNSPIQQMLDTGPDNDFVKDLNRFWTAAGKAINRTFTPVRIAEATHPPCSPTSEFGYCPSDNTVYFNTSFARAAYNSLPAVEADPDTGDVRLDSNQPADFALGVLFSVAWGMAVRHQLFHRELTGRDALIAAVCYSGSYAKNVNVPTGTPGRDITLSPSDLDEATSSMLDNVGQARAFGARGTTGLDRIQAFVKGYRDGLSGC